jgi:hypothetical protein
MEVTDFKGLDDDQAKSFLKRLELEYERLDNKVIARMSVRPATGPKAVLAIQPNRRGLIMSDDRSAPLIIGPGKYQMDQMTAYAGRTDRLGRTKPEQYVCVCDVGDEPVEATLMLPEPKTWIRAIPENMERSAWLRDALSHVDIRSSDGFLGAAAVRVGVRCVDPVKLLKVAGSIPRDVIENKVATEIDEREASQSLEPTSWFSRVARAAVGLIFGERREVDLDVLSKTANLTFEDLYERIELELARSIRTSARKVTAADLYDNIEVRDRIEDDIQRDLQVALDQMGMAVERVAAFVFLCPEYEILLRKRGAVAFDREDANVDSDRVKVTESRIGNKVALHDLASKGQMQISTAEHERKRHDLGQEKKTLAEENALSAQQQAAELSRKSNERDHERDHFEKDEDIRTEVKRKRLQSALEIHQQYSAAEAKRRLEYAHLLATVPQDRVMEIAAILDPKLADALKASKAHASETQRLKDHQDFQDKLMNFVGAHQKQMLQLMDKSLSEVGKVATAKNTLPGPIHVTNVHPSDIAPPRTHVDSREVPLGEQADAGDGEDA